MCTLAALATLGCAASARPAARLTVARTTAAARGAGVQPAPACLNQAPSAQQIDRALDLAQARLNDDTHAFTPGQFPSVTGHDGVWKLGPARGWTSGFFPGSLWMMARYTGRATFAQAAAEWTVALTPQSVQTSGHDIGFEILDSFGLGYEITHAEAYRRVVLRAAASLATRYDPAVGAVRSWGSRDDTAHFLVIVDGLMNLQLLYWAADHGGDPAYANMASRDALTVRDHFIRPDGSLIHLIDFNPVTGAVQSDGNPQAYDLHSTWARGQAWAVAGFAGAYAETGDARFLSAARRTAAFFEDHLPDDCVPYWDFDAPPASAPRDSSASAIAADGLMTLSQNEPDAARRRAELGTAGGLLAALIGHDLATRGQALLAHGTANKPGGSFNTGTSYGDYYFLDALLRYRRAVAAGLTG